MTLTLDVRPETEAALSREAQARGLSLPALLDYAADLLAREAEEEAAQDKADAEEAAHILATSDPSQRRTLADLRAHIEAQRAQQQEAA